MSMSDAFVKAGLVSKEKADKVERDKEQAEKKKQAPSEKKRNTRPDDAPDVKLTGEDFQRYENLWNGEKSKGFLKHLIWSFVPWNVVDKVWGGEEGLDDHCCLCRRKTLTVSEAAHIAGDTAMDHLKARLEFESKNQDRLDTEGFKKEYGAFLDKLGMEAFGNRKLAWKSEDSTKVICMPCYEEFYNWVLSRLLRGDRVIHGIIRHKRKKQWEQSSKE